MADSDVLRFQEQIAAQLAADKQHRALAKDLCRGGPNAFACDESRAAAFREQMAAQDAKRIASVRPTGNFFEAGDGPVDGAAPRGKRCGMPVPESKEAYARALREQIVAKDVRRAASTPPLQQPPPDDDDSPAGVSPRTGRRQVGPMTSAAKDSFNSALAEQIAAREAQRAASKLPPRAPPLGEDAGASDAGLFGRRRRHESRMRPASKESYRRALQEQIADNDGARAASRFHVQAPDNEDLAVAASPEPRTKGKRLGMVRPDSKDSYRSALQRQVSERNAKQAMLNNGDQFYQGMFGGSAAAMPETEVKGRRHAHQIEAPSKQSYARELQGQMAAHSAQRAADAFHARAPASDTQGAASHAKGRRHMFGAPAASKHSYAAALQEQIAERDELREPDGCPRRPPACPAPAASRLSCNGAAVIGRPAGAGDYATQSHVGGGHEHTQIPVGAMAEAGAAAGMLPPQAGYDDTDSLERLINEQTLVGAW